MSDLTVTVHDTITECNRNQWNNLVEQADLGTVFHRYGWLRAIEDGLERPSRHVVVYKKENPVAVLPNVETDLDVPTSRRVVDTTMEYLPTDQLVSVHPGYGGPLVTADTERCLSLLFDAVEETADGGTVSHKLRVGTLNQTKYGKYLTGRGYTPSVVSCRFVVDLDDGWEPIEAAMHKTRRHALNSNRAADVTITRESFTDETVADVHEDYVQNMDRNDGTVYPLSFFEALADHFADRIEVFTANVDDEVIGRYVSLLDREQSAIRYYFAAIPSESAYEYNVSEQLHAGAMQWAIDEGYDHYDLGATGADFDDGLFRHKEKYGGDIEPIIQWDAGLSPVAWNAFKIGRRLYRATNY